MGRQDDIREIEVELGDGLVLGLVADERQRLLQQLEGAGPIRLPGANKFASAAVIATDKLPRDEKTVLWTVEKTVSGRLQQTPIVLMELHDTVAESVDFGLSAQDK